MILFRAHPNLIDCGRSCKIQTQSMYFVEIDVSNRLLHSVMDGVKGGLRRRDDHVSQRQP